MKRHNNRAAAGVALVLVGLGFVGGAPWKAFGSTTSLLGKATTSGSTTAGKPTLTWSMPAAESRTCTNTSVRVYRDGVRITSLSTILGLRTYTDRMATAGSHSYYLTVLNSCGHVSYPSNTVTLKAL